MGTTRCKLRLSIALAFALLAALPALAQAELQTINFDTGTVNTPLDGQGDISFPTNLGFRPYPTQVGEARASSGQDIGDVGLCVQEELATGGETGNCEFFQARTTAVLSRTAKKVSVQVGRFGPLDPPEQAVLVVFSVDDPPPFGTPLGTVGPVPIDASFRTPLSFEDSLGRIGSFEVKARTGPNGESEIGEDLGIDDLAVNFAEGGTPDFSFSTSNQGVAIVQGQQAQVPVQITRVNGSEGPIEFTVEGLPKGVSAEPVTVGRSATSATLTLKADPNAPDTQFQLTTATIKADPLGNTNVAPGPHTAPLAVRVAADLELSIDGHSDTAGAVVPLGVPDCAAIDVPLKVRRDIAMTQDISLSLRGSDGGALPAGLSAEILPSTVVVPGGGLVAERILRLRADPSVGLGQHVLRMAIEGKTSPTSRPHTLELVLSRAEPTATMATATSRPRVGIVPRFGRDGTHLRVHGSGFCPGTQAEVGNDHAIVPTTVVDDHTLEFSVPRYATTGAVVLAPPGQLPRYETEDDLTVDSVRNTDGFQFDNPHPFRDLSLEEFTKAFGADDVYISVNPCWPFGDCTIETGVVDPIARIELAVIGRAPEAHCFGMALGSQQLNSGKESFRQFFPPGARLSEPHVFDLPGQERPSGSVESFLDAYEVRQRSAEYIEATFKHHASLQGQLDMLEREFSRNREPIVALNTDHGAHAVLAYDVVQTPTEASIYAYDPDRPFLPLTEEDPAVHAELLNDSVIHVDKVHKTWYFKSESLYFQRLREDKERGEGKSPLPPRRDLEGGEDGSLWVVPKGTVPDNPSLPELGTLYAYLKSLYVSSSDGAVQTRSSSAGAEFLPEINGVAATTAAGSGTWTTRSDGPLEVSVEGVKGGTYTQAYTGAGFVAAAADVRTAKGVHDAVSGEGDSLSFASGRDRPLRIDLAQRQSAALTTSATLDTHASANGTDSAGFSDGGALTYVHDGAPTTARFTLTSVRRNGGPTTFASGPVAIGRGDRLEVLPVGHALRRVRIQIRGTHGRLRTRVLRSRARSTLHLRLGAPKLSGRHLSLRFKLSGSDHRAVIGAALRLMHGKHLIAHKALSLKSANGARRISWQLPRRTKNGHYRVLIDLRAIAAGSRQSTTASVSAHRGARVRVGR